MQVGDGDKPFLPEFKYVKETSKKHNHAEARPKQEKSNSKAVDDLRTRIKDDYRPKNKVSRGLAYPAGADVSKPVIHITEKSALIDQKLPLDIFKFALKHVGFEDLGSASLVSKYWGYASLEAAKIHQAALLKSFGAFLAEKQSELGIDKLTQNVDLSFAKDLPHLKEMLIRVRFELVKILSPLKNEDLKALEISSLMIKKPESFDVLFCLVRLHEDFVNSGFYKSSTTVGQFCQLGAYDFAFSSIKEIKNKNEYDLALRNMVKEFLKVGDFDRASELAWLITDENIKREVVTGFFSSGKIDEGANLVKSFSGYTQKSILAAVPALKMIMEGKFDKAMKIKDSVNKANVNASVTIYVITEVLENTAYKLIRDANFDEVKRLIAAMGSRSSDVKDRIYEKLAMKYIELDRFDEAVECARLLDPEDSSTGERMTIMNAALCEKGKLDVAGKINAIPITRDNNTRVTVVSIYEDIFSNNFDHAFQLINTQQVFTSTILPYLSKKMWEAGLNERAIELAFKISDLPVRINTLKLFSK